MNNEFDVYDEEQLNDYKKVIKVIDSCKKIEHLNVARNMVYLYVKKYNNPTWFGIKDEEMFEILMRDKAVYIHKNSVFIGFKDGNS